jgi:C1A family cysteine protease
MENKFCLGYVPDNNDPRDYIFKASSSPSDEITSIDLTQGDSFLPIRNQGKIGSCTAFAVGALVEFIRARKSLISWETSPLFTYYTTRQQVNEIHEDSGAMLRDVFKAVGVYGTTKEEIWPYDVSQFTVTPPTSAYEHAEKHQALVYYRIQNNKEDLLACLKEGYPFVFGINLYESFMRTQTDWLVWDKVPMFDATKEKLIGGHAMLAVGFFTEGDKVYIKARNSWGTEVGLGGYHHIPMEYFLQQMGADFWTIRDLEYLEEEKFVPKPKPLPPAPVEIEPEPSPKPIPEIKPEPVPTPAPGQPEPKNSIWKTPQTYFIIIFVIMCFFFLFW